MIGIRPGSSLRMSDELVLSFLQMLVQKVRFRVTSRVRPRFRGSPRFWITVRARVSMDVVSLLAAVVEVLVQIRPDDPSNIPSLFAVEVLHLPQSICAKDDAPKNICPILVTLDTSHLEMSPLKDDAEWNMPTMLVTLDTSHLEMSPLNDDAE